MLVANVIFFAFLEGAEGEVRVNITFFEDDTFGVNPHDNDPWSSLYNMAIVISSGY